MTKIKNIIASLRESSGLQVVTVGNDAVNKSGPVVKFFSRVFLHFVQTSDDPIIGGKIYNRHGEVTLEMFFEWRDAGTVRVSYLPGEVFDKGDGDQRGGILYLTISEGRKLIVNKKPIFKYRNKQIGDVDFNFDRDIKVSDIYKAVNKYL